MDRSRSPPAPRRPRPGRACEEDARGDAIASVGDASPPSSAASPFLGLVTPERDLGDGESCDASQQDLEGADQHGDVDPVYLGVCELGEYWQGTSKDDVSSNERLRSYGFTVLILPAPAQAQGSSSDSRPAFEVAGRALADYLGGGVRRIQVEVGPTFADPVTAEDERFTALFQDVYRRCVEEEESCLLAFMGHDKAIAALTAFGRWFLGREPVEDPALVSAAEQAGVAVAAPAARGDGASNPPAPPLWAVLDLVGIRLAGCSSALRFDRVSPT
eukprot:TRINITY_DN64923_c0_g1_i1.p1 TRINITY_DN64923_c0_g1~~TRINITY_DN64923_c0_g1_i1.p1  ORF type:complete len:274 (-),score=52.03 TRINITY_DN64923_c0_g1_i1:147-968(-)